MERQHVVFQVQRNGSDLASIQATITPFPGAEFISVDHESVWIEWVGESGEMERLRELLHEFGILECQRREPIFISGGKWGPYALPRE